MSRRAVVAAVLGLLGLLGTWWLSALPVESVSGGTCGTIGTVSENVSQPCQDALSGHSALVFVVFFVVQGLLVTAGLLLATAARPRFQLRFWVGPLCLVAFLGCIVFLLPGSITDSKRSDGDPTTTAQWWYFLGALAMPVLLTALVLAVGQKPRNRGESRSHRASPASVT